MKRAQRAGTCLCVASLFLVPNLRARTDKSPKMMAEAIQVMLVDSDEIPLPAEFQLALYENLVRQITKQGFSHVYREGDRSAADIHNLVVIHSTVRSFKAGSERARQATTVAGATSLTVHCRFTRPTERCSWNGMSTARFAFSAGISGLPMISLK